MKKRKVVLSATYSFSQISVGLVLHPYQTMQSLLKEKVFIWMSLLPSMVFVGVVILWRGFVVPFLGIAFGISRITISSSNIIGFFSSLVVFYCIYWQMLLIYLLIRFYLAFERN